MHRERRHDRSRRTRPSSSTCRARRARRSPTARASARSRTTTPRRRSAIDDVSEAEGNAGTTAFTFTVTLSGATERRSSVDFATANGTATAGRATTRRQRHADLRAGRDQQDGHRRRQRRHAVEADETFFVNLSNAAGATIADGQGLGTIENDDAAPTLAIDDVSPCSRATPATTSFAFTVDEDGRDRAAGDGRLRHGERHARPRRATTRARAARSPSPPARRAKTITVLVNGDTTFEANETFFVNLSSPSGATIARRPGRRHDRERRRGADALDRRRDARPRATAARPRSRSPSR